MKRDRNGTSRRRTLLLAAGVSLALLAGGCAKYNTFFNAKRSFDQAEQVREDAIKNNQDPPVPSGTQRSDYENAIKKAQKLIDEYPGHSLTDDALFLQAKSYYRLQSYRMSIRKFDLLFTNFPATDYMEEALYLQSLNYLLLGSAAKSQEFLEKLAKHSPDSKYRSQTLKVSGDNAFALERWEEAEGFYADYLERFPDAEDWDRVGEKLGECRWELERYRDAADVLQQVVERSSSQELAFRADLLRAECLVRTGEYDLAEQVLSKLEEKAPIYNEQGQVLLVQVELLVAQGRADEAFPVLEAMPDEWKTPEVKARSADLRANLRLARNELEEAQSAFRDALTGRAFLDDEFRTRRLSENLNDYLAAENALPDAEPERVPRLKLLQANALLFGFDRPGEALRLYQEAAADTAADSTIAARALYGAVKVYREYLDRPDSAEIFAGQLQERYPESPQAYELGAGEGNLLAFLLEQRSEEQEERYAALSPEERAELSELGGGETVRTAARRGPELRVRRRMVYLARRQNIEFPPTEMALAAARRELERPEGEPPGRPGDGADEPGRDGAPPGPEDGKETAPVPTVRDAFGAEVIDENAGAPQDLPPDTLSGQEQGEPEPVQDVEPTEEDAEQEAAQEEEGQDEEAEEEAEEIEEEKEEEKPKSRRHWEFGGGAPAPGAARGSMPEGYR